WPQRLKSITDDVTEYEVRGKAIRVENYRQSLSHQKIPKIAAPQYRSWGELLTFLGKENMPGSYPYTGGGYPNRRTGDVPRRQPAAPQYRSWGELLTFLGKENPPGSYPYTGGVYPYRRTGEDPIRMFAGEGTPERTNRRFHYLSAGQPAARLSTAFDSVTLYG